MKKFFCIIISFVLAFVLFVPMSTSAVEVPGDGQVTPLANCNHSIYSVSYSYRYEQTDATYHEVYVEEIKTCNNCHSRFEINYIYDFYMEKHTVSTFTYESSVHEGDPSTHYMIYSGICEFCKGRAEQIISTRCRKNFCIDYV